MLQEGIENVDWAYRGNSDVVLVNNSSEKGSLQQLLIPHSKLLCSFGGLEKRR